MTAPIRSMPELLPPPIPARWQVIANARMRGIPNSAIAASLAISNQRVAQIIEKYERRRGSALPRSAGYRGNGRGEKSSFKCENCAGINWVGKRLFSRGRSFCSKECKGLFERVLTIDEIKLCMDSRENGVTWKALAQAVNRPVQTIQKSIWRYLYEGGSLTTTLVELIWRPPGSGHASWQWLIDGTGMVPR